MLKSAGTFALCAFWLLCGAASATPHPASPITVNDCTPKIGVGTSIKHTYSALPGGGFSTSYTSGSNSASTLHISFTNTAVQDVISIRFALVENHDVIQRIHDVGNFRSGAHVNHSFKLSSNASPLGIDTARCVVVKVRFKDGSVWTNPASLP